MSSRHVLESLSHDELTSVAPSFTGSQATTTTTEACHPTLESMMASSLAEPRARSPPLVDMNTAPFFHRVENVDWNKDTEFLSGLAAILGPDPSSFDDMRVEDLTLRARCFYYAQKFKTPAIDFNAYKEWRASQPTSSLVPLHTTVRSNVAEVSTMPDDSCQTGQPTDLEQPNYPANFNEVMDLIQSGKPIPGIKEIPDTILVGHGTTPSSICRRKPWEQAPSLVNNNSVRIFAPTGSS